MKSQEKWQRVTKGQPCPVCGKPDWCAVLTDGTLASCMRVAEGSVKQAAHGGYIHKLTGQPMNLDLNKQPTERRLSDKEMHAKWSPVAWHCCINSEQRVRELAKTLGVAYWALRGMQVGYGECAGTWCWTFPERNPDGLIVGINRRFKDGKKKSAKGCRRGLTYGDEWICPEIYDQPPGPVFLVEGGSDVAACLTLNLSVIGRPTNVGGVKMLAKMLAGVDKSRRIVVVGERDYRPLPEDVTPPHDTTCRCCRRCYPGLQGALDVQEQLRKRLRRRVEWRLPPGKAKDMRAYLQQLRVKEGLHPDNQDAMADAGARIWQ